MRQDGSHERTAPPVPRQVERADPNSGSPTPFSVTGHTVPLELYVSKEVLMPGGAWRGALMLAELLISMLCGNGRWRASQKALKILNKTGERTKTLEGL